MQRVPMLPSQAEIDEHNITHLPFRRWCPFCLRGRGISSGHFSRKEADESQVPVIAVDYCFLGEAPVLFVKDQRTKSVCAHPVPSKGIAHPFGSKQLLKDVESLGYKKIILRGDQEPSIQALLGQVKNGFSGECIIEEAPVEGMVLLKGPSRWCKEWLERSKNMWNTMPSQCLKWTTPRLPGWWSMLQRWSLCTTREHPKMA